MLDVQRVHPGLPGRSDQHLTRLTGLDVEGHRISCHHVGTLEIAQFNDLVVDVIRVTIRDDQVPFSGVHRHARRQCRGAAARSIHGRPGREPRAVGQFHAPAGQESLNRCAASNLGPVFAGLGQEVVTGNRREDHQVVRHLQRPHQIRVEIRLGLAQTVRVERCGPHAPLRVEPLLAMNRIHFLLVRSHPERSVRHGLGFMRQVRQECSPESARIFGQGKLRLGIVQDDHVAHAGTGGPCARDTLLQNQRLHACVRAGACTGGPHNAAPHDNDVPGLTHALIPQQKGSFRSSNRLDSALTKATPRIVGRILCPSMRS